MTNIGTLNDLADLRAAGIAAVVRDKDGDMWTSDGGMWTCQPALISVDAQMLMYAPLTVVIDPRLSQVRITAEEMRLLVATLDASIANLARAGVRALQVYTDLRDKLRAALEAREENT